MTKKKALAPKMPTPKIPSEEQANPVQEPDVYKRQLVNDVEDALPARKPRQSCGNISIVSESII